MNRKDAKIIRKNYDRLVKTLEAPNLLGYLYQEGTLSEDNKELINALRTSKRQNEKLLSILKKRKDGLKMLIKALLVTEVQRFLGNELLEMVAWSEQDMENFKLELEGKIDQHQMMEAKVATLKRENSQLKSKNDENQSTTKDLTDQKQMLEAEVATLKRENSQLKAKNDEIQSKTKDLTDQNQMLEEEVHRLKARIEVLEIETETLKQENESLKPAKTRLQEDETSEHLELRARRNDISSKNSGRELHLKLEMLKQEINHLIEKIKGADKTSLQEDGSETSRQEYHHELRARRNAISYGEGGRASYLADVKKRQSVRQS